MRANGRGNIRTLKSPDRRVLLVDNPFPSLYNRHHNRVWTSRSGRSRRGTGCQRGKVTGCKPSSAPPAEGRPEALAEESRPARAVSRPARVSPLQRSPDRPLARRGTSASGAARPRRSEVVPRKMTPFRPHGMRGRFLVCRVRCAMCEVRGAMCGARASRR